jgi:hypothetical protein
MLFGLRQRLSPLRSYPAIGLAIFLSLSLLLLGACVAKIYPEPGKPYQNHVIGYEFSYSETDDSVQIELRNISEQVLDVETIGLYVIKGGSISAINALEIEESHLEPQATTFITFPIDGEGFIIMNSTGSFVTGDMFEVRYQ